MTEPATARYNSATVGPTGGGHGRGARSHSASTVKAAAVVPRNHAFTATGCTPEALRLSTMLNPVATSTAHRVSATPTAWSPDTLRRSQKMSVTPPSDTSAPAI